MGNRFDDFTRALARGASRREAVKALAASAGAVLVTWLGTGRAEAGEEDPEGGCRPDGTPCRSRRQCCSRNCVDAQCKCRNEGIPCRSSAQCCSRLCEKGICTCRESGETCAEDAQCCEGECRKGVCRLGGDCSGCESNPCSLTTPNICGQNPKSQEPCYCAPMPGATCACVQPICLPGTCSGGCPPGSACVVCCGKGGGCAPLCSTPAPEAARRSARGWQ